MRYLSKIMQLLPFPVNFLGQDNKANLPLVTLPLKKSLAISADCAAEISPFRQLVYQPLPQRIYSVGQLTVERQRFERYYLWDNDTWLQISYAEHCPQIKQIILFYWLNSNPIQSGQLNQADIAPFTQQQWYYQGHRYQRCWSLPTRYGVAISEKIVNATESYVIEAEQVLYSRQLSSNRKEYWFYSLEKNNTDHNYTQYWAQGFALDRQELMIH